MELFTVSAPPYPGLILELTHILTVFLTTIPSIFEGIYHQPTGIAGLHYLALGIGLTGASQINARMLDKIYKYFSAKNGGIGRPEFRLRASSLIYVSPSF